MIIRVRTIKQTAEYIKQCDENTPITEKTIRKWVLSGVLPCVKSGRVYLINLDTLEKFLRGEI